MASEVDVADALQECAEAWEPDVCVLGNVRARDVIAVCERLREAERERDEARAALALEERLKLEACNQAETEAARAEAAEARWHAEHATALEALRQAEAAEARVAELTATLTEINAIRNSIVGAQTVNWSEHVYPLVAALDAAGFAGMPYPEARENVGTLIERANKAEARVAELEAMRDILGSTVQAADEVIIRGSEGIRLNPRS